MAKYSQIGQVLLEKWDGLVGDIDNDLRKVNTAILLENELQKGLLTEDTQSGQSAGGATWGATQGSGSDIAPFQHYLLPLVRRVYPNLIANELVGVQPMTGPASLVFYLKYRYAGLVDRRANTLTGKLSDVASSKGQTAPGTEYGNFIGNTWNVDAYYSLQKVWREQATAGASPADGSINHDFLATPRITSVPVVVESTMTNSAGAVVKTRFAVIASGTVTPTLVSAPAGVSIGGTSTVTLSGTNIVVTAPNLSGFTPASWSHTVTYDYNMENQSNLPEIDLEVGSEPVTVQTRKLRVKWTPEASQDLKSMHGIDAEQELIALLANEVTAEIDREIINDLIINALIRVEYDYSNPFLVGGVVNQGASAPDGSVAGGTGSPAVPFAAIAGVTSFDDRNKALFYQILEVSAQIYRQSLRGAGNWIVTSPEISAKLESLLEFKPSDRTDFQYSMAITHAGTLNGQFKVYKDPLFPVDLILVGFKGQSFLDAGYFYCPYIPLQMTPTILDPETFAPRKGLMTRYGKTMVENGARMYGTIRVSNIKAVGANVLPGSDLASTYIDGQKSSLGSLTNVMGTSTNAFGPGGAAGAELI